MEAKSSSSMPYSRQMTEVRSEVGTPCTRMPFLNLFAQRLEK